MARLFHPIDGAEAATILVRHFEQVVKDHPKMREYLTFPRLAYRFRIELIARENYEKAIEWGDEGEICQGEPPLKLEGSLSCEGAGDPGPDDVRKRFKIPQKADEVFGRLRASKEEGKP